LTKKETADHKYLIEELKGDAIEMEGGGVAMVSTLNKIPFLVVRTISDKADGTAVKDFNEFLPIVAKNSYKIVNSIIQKI